MLFQFSFSILFFFHIWDLGYNSSEFILAMLRLLFQVFTNLSSKVNTEFISYNALCWWSIHVPPFHRTIINRLWSSGYLAPVMKSFAFKIWLFLLYILTPSPNGAVFCFNQYYKEFIVSFIYISGIVNIWWEIPLGRVEGQFSLRKWFCCYLGVSLPQTLVQFQC